MSLTVFLAEPPERSKEFYSIWVESVLPLQVYSPVTPLHLVLEVTGATPGV